ncbi:hypothetical protein GCM10025857_67350 [Alicyclobacillus contaminans]|uniref:Uncharacterized protein n=1 Tax=Tetragenococcus osmophilus TaxID=526944 RepID=A0AA37XNL7_9ENTE|nr:hypothetical protein [Tetragenococcus osmophilus]GMA55342.1 hypothetical protein GCM10025857_66990 [Alicyclobacillus contaminans]GMA55378.1 hypothetical protein GCM10025857_67350 [Alicyclobacillus contaminans]GMA73439.1 hypothetical protein GCM10025885_24880 [Tetragenococcus osmophilus]GMA73475.1 hypothetical protein GCM10025885_25240 [Tetragenococcus osmophilus]GMA73519.1 hypothetical protein GCM10025885_25680 [Tetragenococcus osmophilus]
MNLRQLKQYRTIWHFSVIDYLKGERLFFTKNQQEYFIEEVMFNSKKYPEDIVICWTTDKTSLRLFSLEDIKMTPLRTKSIKKNS